MLWDRGRGEGYLSLFMIGSDPERVNFTNLAQPRRVKIDKYFKNTINPAGQKLCLCGVLSKRYGTYHTKVWLFGYSILTYAHSAPLKKELFLLCPHPSHIYVFFNA